LDVLGVLVAGRLNNAVALALNTVVSPGCGSCSSGMEMGLLARASGVLSINSETVLRMAIRLDFCVRTQLSVELSLFALICSHCLSSAEVDEKPPFIATFRFIAGQ
jgi:hypothetical protein